jgi:hypothetical protein
VFLESGIAGPAGNARPRRAHVLPGGRLPSGVRCSGAGRPDPMDGGHRALWRNAHALQFEDEALDQRCGAVLEPIRQEVSQSCERLQSCCAHNSGVVRAKTSRIPRFGLDVTTSRPWAAMAWRTKGAVTFQAHKTGVRATCSQLWLVGLIGAGEAAGGSPIALARRFHLVPVAAAFETINNNLSTHSRMA